MPKYYVRDGQDKAIVDAEDPIDACVRAIRLMKFTTVMVGGHYWVSEQGFGPHAFNDLKIDSDKVNERYISEFEG